MMVERAYADKIAVGVDVFVLETQPWAQVVKSSWCCPKQTPHGAASAKAEKLSAAPG